MATATTKLLLSNLASTVKSVPSNYIRPISDCPNLTEVKNHGIPKTIINNMLSISRAFFKLVESERLKSYSDDLQNYLRLHCYPLQDYIHEWPSNPLSFRDYIDKALGKHEQHMALNYCPPCPQPELTYGLPGHTDPNLITVLLQDDVPGLQVLRNGKWLPVSPIPNTFIVNIGDQMQVLSNDLYKSVLYRALVNCDKERISIPTFYCPSPNAVIAPTKDLIDERHLAFYKNFTYAKYYQNFWNMGLAAEGCLDLFKASTT
ncbi:hypothetical protein CICLE_v10006688mg [Citrus x clementina]|uniref:Fe2OG dioxygenase domain-containing protein n=1 Tax=Citrus clementina TaxID=85681 RepID=V4SD75_CITCL|nr:hypothetical protein CICLE_v10006688mg [Citrus x clementina]